MKKILLATFNPGKIKEYKLLLGGLSLKILGLKDIGIKEKIEENGDSFLENAFLKADFYSKLANLPTLADDSGLEIDSLNGMPGVRSRRWPGYEATDRELLDFTLKKLKNFPWKERRAKLKTALVFIIPHQEARAVFISNGTLEGIIATEPRGRLVLGYPYRPIFYLPKIKKTLAQLGFREETKIGQRRKALKKLIPVLELLPKINFNLSLSSLGAFEKKVLEEVKKIPLGKTKTYSQIAGAISRPKSARAVGRALSKNPLPLIIPCHRVVGNQDIGGYVFGKKAKRHLLKLEKEANEEISELRNRHFKRRFSAKG